MSRIAVRPYNPTKKLSGNNYQAMPYMDSEMRGGNSSSGDGLPQSPASTWKTQSDSSSSPSRQQHQHHHPRKDTGSTAAMSTDSPASDRLLPDPATASPRHYPPSGVSGLSAQLMSSAEEVGRKILPDGYDVEGDHLPDGPNLSIRDMFAQDEYYAEDHVNDNNGEKKNLKTPPTSLGGTPVGPQALPGSPGLDASAAMLGAPSKMTEPVATASKTGVSNGNSILSGNNKKYGRRGKAPPVLYSAIGSLEDPSNQSFQQNRWRNKNAVAKYEFPSAQFIPPVNMTKKISPSNNQKKSGMSELLGDANATKSSTKQEQDSPAKKPQAKTHEALPEAAPTTAAENMELNQGTIKASNLRLPGQTKSDDKRKSVKIAPDASTTQGKKKVIKRPVEQFRPSSDAYTPRMGKKEIKYKPAEKRTPVQQMSSGLGTLSRPNFRDALRRVAMILRQHIVKIERRFERHMTAAGKSGRDGLFMQSMKDEFCEDRFATPTYKVTMVRVPMARGGMVGGLKKVRKKHEIPSESEIYDFAHRLFKSVQLSSECSIVCLIYIERLMEVAKVPLLASTWRPIVMCGLLLASKVWQDLSSWNIEFATVYPQYSLNAIHRLELQFLRMVKWDLYISSTLYAKYYFALRALVSKQDFRQRYNRMVGGVDSVQAAEARKIEERSTLVKEEALLQLSRSM
uniref:Cyclin N-terminal domain-containing protein n=1 Tax=Amphora coffeiformis TaxID=265554 RepID=A0A7S3P0N5_9STRA